MGMSISPSQILTNRVTNIVLRSDHGNWTIGNPGSPVFTVSGAAGDSISDQVILDTYTAVISIKSAQANAQLTITDPLNKEAASVSVWGAAQFTTAGRAAVDDNSKVPDGKHNQSDRENSHTQGQH